MINKEDLILVEDAEDEEDILLDVVCFTCPYLFRCGPRAEHNPIDCAWLRDWIAEKIEIYERDYEYEDEEDE